MLVVVGVGIASAAAGLWWGCWRISCDAPGDAIELCANFEDGNKREMRGRFSATYLAVRVICCEGT
jgi:hypothetical protein